MITKKRNPPPETPGIPAAPAFKPPTKGGSYLRDPVTGELTRQDSESTQPQEVPEDKPEDDDHGA